jgi:DNA-binding beta-propeller fold protein YncE
MGALEFVDPAVGDELLVVHTSPPALTKVDTRVSEGVISEEVIARVPLCNYPNLLELYRPAGREWLAFVSCYNDDAVAVIGLGAFTRIATVTVDDGPNELVIDDQRARLYVVNTLASTISILELNHLSPRYLEEIVRIGVGERAE